MLDIRLDIKFSKKELFSFPFKFCVQRNLSKKNSKITPFVVFIVVQIIF